MKFRDIQNQRFSNIVKSEITGMFHKPLSRKRLNEFVALSERDGTTDDDYLLWLFRHVYCDDKGNRLEDMRTKKDLEDLSVEASKAIFADIADMFGGGQGNG